MFIDIYSNWKFIYYGKTYRPFFKRVIEHMVNSNLTGKVFRQKCQTISHNGSCTWV